MIKKITDDSQQEFIEYLRGKKATFLLALSNTETADIEGITQAGIPNMLHLTPTLDSEFLCLGEVKSLEDIAKTPKGVPTPALITRAIHLLKPFNNIELLNLGLRIEPKVNYFKINNFDIQPSNSIKTGANIDAQTLFQKGVDFGQNYKTDSDYIIIGESVPSGTTTAKATAIALGYDCENYFSSSFKNVPNDIKKETIEDALKNMYGTSETINILGKISDNMLIFNAGFILGLNNKLKVVLAGGTQMVCVLLVVNKILETMKGEMDTSNLALWTTKWIVEDKNSDIKKLLEMLNFNINSFYSDFDFSLTNHPALKLYDEGEAKEGVGAGGALVYGILNGLDKNLITKKVESIL